jgi:hypothetical protein
MRMPTRQKANYSCNALVQTPGSETISTTIENAMTIAEV